MKNKIKIIISVITIVIISLCVINFMERSNQNKLSGEIVIWANNNNFNYIEEVSKKFMLENSKVKINIKQVNNKKYFTDLINSIGHEDEPDIALVNSIELEKLKNNKNVKLSNQKSILDTYKMNFSESSMQSVEINNEYIAVPFTSSPIVMYLREDLLNKYGYTHEEINTWDDFINMGEDIYKKSKGKVKVLSGIGEDYDYLIKLLIMQNIGDNTSKESVEKAVNSQIKLLKDKNILNMNKEEDFLARISSDIAIKEIRGIEEKCEWTANSAPSKEIGGNRFFVDDALNFITLNNKNNKLANEFLIYLSNDTDTALKYILNDELFSSYLYAYKSKKIEEPVKNFKGESPLVVMSNILKKAPKIKDYDLYKELIQKFIK